VIDIGCGVGVWLKVFKEKYNIKDILGIDGDYVNKNMLQINDKEFVSANLERVYVAPKKFDLAICMEVGEHLPDDCADNLVKSVTNASDFIMFSAAIPGQEGTYHINTQYPEYWAKKFIDQGYVCIDHIRKQIWNNKEILFWYRQNALLYIKKEVFENKFKPLLMESWQKTDPEFITRVHPEMMLYYKGKFEQTKNIIGFLRYQLYPIKVLFGGKKKRI